MKNKITVLLLVVIFVLLAICIKQGFEKRSDNLISENVSESASENETELSSESDSEPPLPDKTEYFSEYEAMGGIKTEFSYVMEENPIDACPHLGEGYSSGVTVEMIGASMLLHEAWKTEVENVYSLILDLDFLSQDYKDNLILNQESFVTYTDSERKLYSNTYEEKYGYGSNLRIYVSFKLQSDYHSKAIDLIDMYMALTDEDYKFVYYCEECNTN